MAALETDWQNVPYTPSRELHPLWGMCKGPSLLVGGQRHKEDGGDHSADMYTWKLSDNSLAADGTTSTSSRLSPIQTHPVHGLWTDS